MLISSDKRFQKQKQNYNYKHDRINKRTYGLMLQHPND